MSDVMKVTVDIEVQPELWAWPSAPESCTKNAIQDQVQEEARRFISAIENIRQTSGVFPREVVIMDAATLSLSGYSRGSGMVTLSGGG